MKEGSLGSWDNPRLVDVLRLSRPSRSMPCGDVSETNGLARTT